MKDERTIWDTHRIAATGCFSLGDGARAFLVSLRQKLLRISPTLTLPSWELIENARNIYDNPPSPGYGLPGASLIYVFEEWYVIHKNFYFEITFRLAVELVAKIVQSSRTRPPASANANIFHRQATLAKTETSTLAQHYSLNHRLYLHLLSFSTDVLFLFRDSVDARWHLAILSP